MGANQNSWKETAPVRGILDERKKNACEYEKAESPYKKRDEKCFEEFTFSHSTNGSRSIRELASIWSRAFSRDLWTKDHAHAQKITNQTARTFSCVLKGTLGKLHGRLDGKTCTTDTRSRNEIDFWDLSSPEERSQNQKPAAQRTVHAHFLKPSFRTLRSRYQMHEVSPPKNN